MRCKPRCWLQARYSIASRLQCCLGFSDIGNFHEYLCGITLKRKLKCCIYFSYYISTGYITTSFKLATLVVVFSRVTARSRKEYWRAWFAQPAFESRWNRQDSDDGVGDGCSEVSFCSFFHLEEDHQRISSGDSRRKSRSVSTQVQKINGKHTNSFSSLDVQRRI